MNNVTIKTIIQLSPDVGISSSLTALNVKEKDFEIMATNAMKDACVRTNPASTKLVDIVQIFKNAM